MARIARARMVYSSEFTARAGSLLEIFFSLRADMTIELSEEFHVHLKAIMRCKMTPAMRESLDDVCHQFNFVAFDRNGFYESVENFHNLFESKDKVCRRSNPPTFLTELDNFREENRDAFSKISAPR